MPALNHTSPKYEPFAIPCVTAFATAAAQAAVSSVPYTAAAEDTAPPEALAAASTTVVALVKLEIVVTSLPPPEPAPVTTMILPASAEVKAALADVSVVDPLAIAASRMRLPSRLAPWFS